MQPAIPQNPSGSGVSVIDHSRLWTKSIFKGSPIVGAKFDYVRIVCACDGLWRFTYSSAHTQEA
jgi:hypothetical protein